MDQEGDLPQRHSSPSDRPKYGQRLHSHECKFFSKPCKRYIGQKGGNTTKGGNTCSCREVNTLPSKLEVSNTGPLGPGHCTGLEFYRHPTQVTRPRGGVSLLQEQSLLNEEISKMLSKGAISELPPEEANQRFYSSLFLVPKKDGGTRPVINLKSLNEYVVPHHFKMEGIHTLIKRNDWMTKINLKDAYFMIPIHRSVLRFSTQNRLYQFSCLPFGLSCAPWVFTKTLRSQC